MLDSGFLDLGPNSERYVRLDIAGGVAGTPPPRGPDRWSVKVLKKGEARIVAAYYERGVRRATEWALTYTTDGTTPGTPPAVAPTVTIAMPSNGLAILVHTITGLGGSTLNIRLQTRRNDGGTWIYSENSTVKTVVVSNVGSIASPNDSIVSTAWPGRPPDGLG
ncbi:MAG: hypothetical protein D6788_11365 [Planctomycetota bacterium]|nr:MAG: hypothetical protein D6788_11365 [Planctomycetota bacterium]